MCLGCSPQRGALPSPSAVVCVVVMVLWLEGAMEINYACRLISPSNSAHRSSSQTHRRAGHPNTACRDRTPQLPPLADCTIAHTSANSTHTRDTKHTQLSSQLLAKTSVRRWSLATRQNGVSPQGHSIILQQSEWLRVTRWATNIANIWCETDASKSTIKQAEWVSWCGTTISLQLWS